MFRTGIMDFLTLVPVLLPLIFGFTLAKAEKSESVRPAFSFILGLVFFCILGLISFFLNTNFSSVSLIVLNGLFKLDHFVVNCYLALSCVALLVYLLKVWGLLEIKIKELFLLLSLVSALLFSNSLLLVFAFAELIFIKTILAPDRPVKLADLLGSKVRLIGVILLLGSVGLSFGKGTALTVDFLRSHASELYTSDHLFVLGSLFILAGLIEILWKMTVEDDERFGSRIFFGGLGLCLALLKYSSSNIFSVLQEAHVYIQWFLILSLIYISFRTHRRRRLIQLVKDLYTATVLLSVVFLLPYTFDGEGEFSYGFAYLFSATISLILAFAFERYLSLAKGDDLLITDLKSVGTKWPVVSIGLLAAVASALAFPLSTGLWVVLPGLKMVLQLGFYWVASWTLFVLVVQWALFGKFLRLMRISHSCEQDWSFWRGADAKDMRVFEVVSLLIFMFLTPLLFRSLLGLLTL